MGKMGNCLSTRGRTLKDKVRNSASPKKIEELKGTILAQIEIIQDEYEFGYKLSYAEQQNLLRIQNELK